MLPRRRLGHSEAERSRPAECAAILRRSLPGLLHHATVPENQRTLTTGELAAARTDGDACANANAAAAADDNAGGTSRDARHRTFGHQRISLTPLGKLGSECRCATAHNTIIGIRASTPHI